MSIFGSKRVVRVDPNEAIVDEINHSYPFRDEAFGARSIFRLVVWTVLEMKKRGLI